MDSRKIVREDVDNGSEYQQSSNSSDCDEVDETFTTRQKFLRSNSSRSKATARLPTRRPDPNVFNRNALMARENRKKKKEYIEMLEKDIEKQCKFNKKLQRMIKRQSEYIQSLQNEKNYFKSILANETQILSLVNLVRTATVAQPGQGKVFDKSLSPSPSPSSSPLETYLMSDDNDNGIVDNIVSFSSILDNSDIFSTDYNLPLSECNSWDDILNGTDAHTFDTFEVDSIQETDTKYSTINDDHSYFSTVDKSMNEELGDSGICLHISGGKFSLEFCAACHENSKKPVIKEF